MTAIDTELRKVRSLFLSDIHLGTRACRADGLLAFLKSYDADYIFLLGDIVDFWAMSRGIHWPSAHSTVVQKILKRARHGVKVFLIPGNHDEVLREHIGDFEHAIAHRVKQLALDGVICGHIHTPAIKRIHGITYMNCGDWVDSCTAIVERYDGRIQLVRGTHLERPADFATTDVTAAEVT